jgi:cytochrome c
VNGRCFRAEGEQAAAPARIALPALTLALLLAACGAREARDPRQPLLYVADGDPRQGRMLLRQHGCVSCHLIPGVRGASGLVGPPLVHWSRRSYIAGSLPNTPDHLVPWIMRPQALQRDTAMPDMGVSEADARHMAAYLYTLR